MLKNILAISGKPGLFKLVSKGNRTLIVETLDEKHKRMPAFGTDRIISLDDIAIYTEDDQVPLSQVINNIKEMLGGEKVALNPKTASREELADFMSKALPNYDRDRVHPTDVQRLIQWYNILVDNKVIAE